MEADNKQRGWVLVTGASSGIGADFARVFARKKRDVALVARSRERLDALAGELTKTHGVRARVLPADLARPGAAEEIQRALQADGIEVETLVNNAGFGMHGPFVELDPRRQSEMISVNVVALTELCRVFAPDMVSRGQGGILNVASTGAFSPGPTMSVYCATKAFVLSFTEALANELHGSGVTVTCLCPGVTATSFHEVSGTTRMRLVRVGTPMTSVAVAEAGERALLRGSSLAVPGLLNRALAMSVRFVSIRAAAGVARWFLASAPERTATP
jgi:short-subunit dehydrogenase